MKIISTNSLRGVQAFTLIEVTISLAITAVALVTLMGMIPQGLSTMKEAADQAIEARIHQQVLAELQLTPFDDQQSVEDSPLDDFHQEERFYDSQGIELADSDRGGFEHVYTARIHVPTGSGAKHPVSVGENNYNGISIPGSDVDSSPYLRTVIVEVTSLPYTDGISWDEEKTQRHINTFQTTLVKMGQDYVAP